MNEDMKRLAERLEHEASRSVDEAIAEVARIGGTRALRRRIAIGSAIAGFVVVISVAAVIARDTDQPEQGVTVADEPDATTTTSAPPSTSEPVPTTTVKTVDTDFSTGWTAVHVGLPSTESGWVPTALMAAPEVSAGDVMETYAPTGELIGYYLRAAGFVAKDEFESPDFDWQAFIREANADDPAFADRVITDIEQAGGLGEIQTAESAGVG